MDKGEIFFDSGVSTYISTALEMAFDNIHRPGDFRTELCDIMRSEKSDKGFGPYGKHNYTQVYFELFKNRRKDVQSFFEVGLGTNNVDIPSNMGAGGTPGASVRGWRTFFSNAKIFGADVDKSILFEEERIVTTFIDQTDKESIIKAFDELGLNDVDIILDDGLHRFAANKNLYENSRRYVRTGGLYIIEDIAGNDPDVRSTFLDYFRELRVPLVFAKLPHQRAIRDNCLAIIEC